MPARVIRSEIVTSRSLSRVSLEADLTFRNLLLVVDDYGRCDARLPVLRAALFATRPAVTEELLAGWLDELEREGCLERYEAMGASYLLLPKWETHRGRAKRSEKSRFPDPPGTPGNSTGGPGDPGTIPGDPGNPRGSADAVNGLPEIRGNPRIPRESVRVVLVGDEGRLLGDEGRLVGAPADPPAAVRPAQTPPAASEDDPKSRTAPAEPGDLMLAALQGIFPKVHSRALRLKARACLAYYRARGERRTDWTAQVESWIAKDLAEEGPQRPATMSPKVECAP